MDELNLKASPSPLPTGKTCTSCNITWALTEDHYAKDSANADGFKNQCKECDKTQHENELAEEYQEIIQALDRKSAAALKDMASRPDTGTGNLPHVATMLEDMLSAWGGSLGFAQRIMAEYLASKPGSMIRQRYSQMIARFVLEASDKGYVQMPLDKMTDEDLEKAYLERKEELKLRLLDHDKQAG